MYRIAVLTNSMVQEAFFGRTEVPGYASISGLLFLLTYRSATCSTQAQ